MIRRTRLISALLCCLLGFGLLLQTGCNSTVKEPIHVIRFWHNYAGGQKAALEMLTETYNYTEGKERGVQIVPLYKTKTEIDTYFADSFAEGKPADYPEISVVTNELAYMAMCRGLLVKAEECLTASELSGYSDAFLNEGRFTGSMETYIFPIAKASDITIINDSLWRHFYNETHVDAEQWFTWNGILELAEEYYAWSGGQALFALESLQDYIFTYSAQQLPAIIQAGNDEIKINTNKGTLHAIWDFYYGGVLRGYILQTHDIQQALEDGKILGYAGLPHQGTYFPLQYKMTTGNRSSLLLSASPYPSVSASRMIAPQKGTGVSVFDHGEALNRESYAFLHWFCSNENIFQFSIENSEVSSYVATYTGPTTKEALKQLSLLDSVQYNLLSVSITQVLEGETYAPTGFIGYDSFCAELTASLENAAAEARADVLTLCESGTPYRAAVAQVDTEAAFETWYQSVIELASKY